MGRRKTFCCPVLTTSIRSLFKVIPETAKEVKPGEVAVVVSNTGKDPSKMMRREMAAKMREGWNEKSNEQAE